MPGPARIGEVLPFVRGRRRLPGHQPPHLLAIRLNVARGFFLLMGKSVFLKGPYRLRTVEPVGLPKSDAQRTNTNNAWP